MRVSLIFCSAFAASVLFGQGGSPISPPGMPNQQPTPYFKKPPKAKDTSHRILIGTVRTPDNKEAQGAIVHLSNQRTGEGRAFTTQSDGKFRFEGLDRETIFYVIAEYKGMKSRTRSLTPFDSRDDPIIDLTLEPVPPASGEQKPDEKKTTDKDKEKKK